MAAGDRDSIDIASPSITKEGTLPVLQEGPPAPPVLPVAALIDELKHEDMAVRVASIHRLTEIASVLGPERVRNELIPYLSEFIEDDDDVLLALAEQLPLLLDYIGGPSFGQILLIPLESIASVEEPSVRDKAIESIIAISTKFSGGQIVDYLLPLLERLATGEWFASRTACCPLFPVAYDSLRRAVEQNASRYANILQLYVQLCTDETPMVRRAACGNFGRLCQVIDKDVFLANLFTSFMSLSKDEQDSVRLLVVDSCVQIGKLLVDEEWERIIFPTILGLCQDLSWRVRYMAADRFVDLCSKLSTERINHSMLDCFIQLLRDAEPEVRTVAAAKVTDFSNIIEKPLILSRIIPVVQELAVDPSQYVRTALAVGVIGLSSLLGKNEFLEHLLPLFLLLLRDSFSDVRLNIISRLDQIHYLVGIDVFTQSLLPAITSLSSDSNWRVRLAIVENMPSVAKQLGNVFFELHLCDLALSWMCDTVFAVRFAATKNLSRFVEIFGVQWSLEQITPRILEMFSHTHYLYRMNALTAVKELSAALPSDTFTSTFFPHVLKLADDVVPNVRFFLAKFFREVATNLPQSCVNDQILPILGKMAIDDDDDVRYFADLTMKTCKALTKQQEDVIMKD